MGKILLGIVIGAFLFYAYQRVHERAPETDENTTEADSGFVGQPAPSGIEARNDTSGFRCDGRTHCSQMHSCEEATFFLRNCPNVKMDGNNDGVPCEKQWCDD